jgi:hypothetical protein
MKVSAWASIVAFMFMGWSPGVVLR